MDTSSSSPRSNPGSDVDMDVDDLTRHFSGVILREASPVFQMDEDIDLSASQSTITGRTPLQNLLSRVASALSLDVDDFGTRECVSFHIPEDTTMDMVNAQRLAMPGLPSCFLLLRTVHSNQSRRGGNCRATGVD